MIHPRALPRWFAKATVLLILITALMVLAIRTFGTTTVVSCGCAHSQHLDEPIVF